MVEIQLCLCMMMLVRLTLVEGFSVVSLALKAPANCPPCIICPGFGNDARDYTNPIDGGEAVAFSSALRRRGLETFVVPVERPDWFNVANAVLTWDFWKGTCRPDGPGYSWYLRKLKDTVAECLEETGAEKVVLVGHSAGGWLARAALADGEWEEGIASEDVVAGLVTLGTPHYPGSMDMTRGALTFTAEEYPGAFLKDKGVFYISVAGAAIEGDKEAPRRTRERFAYGSYQTVCGEGATMGDACVPLQSAHLEGAEQITLEDVFHSIDKPNDWYGAEGVVDRWLSSVLRELQTPSKGGVTFPELLSTSLAKLFR